MTARRAGQTGQIDAQGRSHFESWDQCGSYRLIERVAPNTWKVEWIAKCDEPRQSVIRFVSRDAYDRHF